MSAGKLALFVFLGKLALIALLCLSFWVAAIWWLTMALWRSAKRRSVLLLIPWKRVTFEGNPDLFWVGIGQIAIPWSILIALMLRIVVPFVWGIVGSAR